MANRIWKEVKTARSGVRNVYARFFPAGTGAPTGLRGSGVASVARTAQGVFELTLEDPWPSAALICAVPGVQHTTAADLVAQCGDFTAGTASANAKIIVRVNAGATPTDITANANSSVSVELAFQNNPRS